MKSQSTRVARFATLASLLLLGISAVFAVGTGPSFKGPAGVQLYSLRALFLQNVPTTLDIVKGYGVREVELAGWYNLTPEQWKKELDARGLVPIACHFSMDRFRTEPEKIAQESKAVGLKYVGFASIPHDGTLDAAETRAAVEVLNNAGKILAKYGIKCMYHCHGYEFEPGAAGPGTTAMDILMKETDPKYVTFEMDILWVLLPGESPEKWLAKYPGRWELMHMKDYRKGLPLGIHTGKANVEDNVVLGTGQVNWPVVLAAAKKYGVKHYFIEDESSDARNQVPLSLRYLETVKW